MCAMNSWLLYDKQGRCASIPYGIHYTPWGVLEQAGDRTPNANTVIYLNDMGGGNIAFMCKTDQNNQYWASARDDNSSIVQFQAPNGWWITSPQGDEMFRVVPSGDGYFVLFSNHIGKYIALPYEDPGTGTYLMVALASFADATRFRAVSVNNPPRPVVFDFLDLYNNASGLSFAGISLANMNLSQANLSLCDLTGVTSLSGCVLNGANLQQAKLAGLHLAGASLSATDFTNAHLDNCVFANLGPATDTTVVQSVTPYAQGGGGSGIGDCKMTNSSTEGFAFDFDSSGKPDHLVFYHPGQDATSQKALYIIKSNGDDTFTTRYSGDSIGDFNLTNHANVHGFAFDFETSGKLDHLVFYCPGEKIVYIFKSEGDGTFTQRYPTQANPLGTGIGGYDLAAPSDQGFAFDGDGVGRLNYLVFFRPTRGAIYIMKSNGNGTFTSIVQVGDAAPPYPPSQGIGGCQFLDPNTRGFAFDVNGRGNLDHLVFYYPSQNSVYVIQNQGGTFTAVYAAANPGGAPALPGFALTEQHIRGFAYDFEGSGKQDYLVFYAPGQKVAVFCEANQQSDGTITFSQSYYSNQGIGGYDLAYAGDLAFPFDYEGAGKLDYITLFRPGQGAVFITRQRLLSGLYPILEQAQLPGATLSTPLPGINLSGANLAGATLDCNLSGADLSGGVVLTGATITANCDLTGANLSGAHMSGLDLTKVKSMRNVNLSGADLTGAKLEGVDLTGAILVGTKLCNMDLTQTTFSQPIARSTDPNNRTSFAGSTLPYTVIGKDWSYLELTGTTLAGMPTDLTDLNAVSVMWPSASFINCILDGANFSSAILDQANFSQSSLQESAQKNHVIFNDASMIGAKFIQAVLQNVSFRGTVLGGEKDNLAANFSYAFIASCDFTGANLYSAIFAEATLISQNTFNTAANLLLANFSNAYLPGADFSGATLQGATFDGAFMVQGNLSGADLSPAEEGAKATSLAATCLQAATFSDTTNLSGASMPNAFFSVTGQAGQITCQYYDLDGSLTAPFPYNYPAGQLPAPACLSDDTVCPNLQTKKENSNVSFQKMMTSVQNPPTQWKPSGTSNLARFR
jgi:uncharacterized protein YjbI with pentapeptide repeats